MVGIEWVNKLEQLDRDKKKKGKLTMQDLNSCGFPDDIKQNISVHLTRNN